MVITAYDSSLVSLLLPNKIKEHVFELTASNTLTSYNYTACRIHFLQLAPTCACKSKFSIMLMKGKLKYNGMNVIKQKNG